MPEDIPEVPVALTNDEIADRACDWSDYRKSYGERHPSDQYVYKAGWDAGFDFSRRRARKARAERDESLVETMVAQFSSEVDYDGAEVIRRLRMTQHIMDDHEPGKPCAVCEDDDRLDADTRWDEGS